MATNTNIFSKMTKPPDNNFLPGDLPEDTPEKRKLLLMRRPRGSRRSEVSGRTLYTITSCSEGTQSEAVQSEDESSARYTKDDVISKPTNFATIVTDTHTGQLPAISGRSQSRHRHRSTSSHSNKPRYKTTYLPNINTGSMARKNWINAEVKTFNMWHELSSAKTDVKNSLPTLEMIKIEKMMEDMRRQRRKDPSAANFSSFMDQVKKENNLKHEQHILSNPRYNTTLSMNKF